MLSYVNDGFDTEVKPLTKQILDDILASDYQRQLISRIRQEPDRDRRATLKVKLRAIIPMGYADMPEYQRYKQTYQQIVSTIPADEQAAWTKKHKLVGMRKIEFFRPSHLFMIDIDHVNPKEIFQGVCNKLSDAQLDIKNLLAWAYVTASNDGLRLILKGRPGSDIAKDQAWFAQLCGLRIDAACKDITRLSFLTTDADTLYRNDNILFGLQDPCYDNPSFGYHSLLPQQTLFAQEDTQLSQPISTQQAAVESKSSAELPQSYHGFSYHKIIDTYWLLNNHGHEPAHGDRDTLTYQLACDLRHICNNNFELLNAIIPCYDNFPQSRKEDKIRNALNSTYNAMPGRLVKVLEYLENQKKQSAIAKEDKEDKDAEQIPQMPKKLPRLIDLLISNTPDIYKPAVAHAVFPSLATHLHLTQFRYIDNVLHEATLMNVLMAGTGAGKDCISEPINRIMADIRVRDAANLQREKQWKNEVVSKGANKDKKQRPEGLIIQEVDPDMTNPAFVMRTAEAEGHFLYAKLNEIDQFDALRGSSGQQYQIMCLAFDPGNRYGQTRVSSQSVTEKVQIRFNWNASTTILKGKRYFRRVLTDGPISRINFCTIPEREIGAPMPVFGTYTEDFDNSLKGYIDNLCKTTGIVNCPEAFALAKKLSEECADYARLTQNRVYENLSFRANVIAWLKACVLYVANGCVWETEMEDFIRWSLQYDLWCKMEFFGDEIQSVNEDKDLYRATRTNKRNLLVLLPEQFSLQDANGVRLSRGLDESGTANMIAQWVHRGFIQRLADGTFKKQ